jgi:predicted Zn-dependent protease
MKGPSGNLKEKIKEARKAIARGDVEGGLRALCELAEEYPNNLGVQFAYATELFLLNRYAEAVSPFERVLRINPVHEWASLGLFHSLFKTDRWGDAVAEVRRFRDAGGESMEYRRLAKDISRHSEALEEDE